MAIAASTHLYEPYRFSIEDYHRMAEAGFSERMIVSSSSTGEIIAMSPIGLRHLSCVDRLAALLRRDRSRAIVRVQGSIRLGNRTEPQPDLVLLEPRPDFYAKARRCPAMSSPSSR